MGVTYIIKIPFEILFDFSNICSPRYTYTFSLKLSFKKLTFKKVLREKEYTYTLDFEKLLKNLLLKNLCKRSGTRTLEFWKSFRKVGGKCVHWIFWKLNYLKIMNGQIIRIVRQFSRTAYFIMIKCNICACIHMIDKRRWLYTKNAGQEMLSKFSDNLGCSTEKEKDKLQNMYIIEGKNTGWLPVCFLKVAKSFLKKLVDI